ncbi:MAG: histidinol-phosphatase [Firmicutes bacterium HGW-Firmicutes-14]|jgi:putative hydrolase|nr:MAG: histidinol-phosphatase [Firmicutes bacterium HGW-Firmicutes-14]
MEFFADWHTHSTYSDGRGTIEENIRAAVSRGLEELAITDHGPANIGVGVRGPESYLQIKDEIRKLNPQYDSISVKTGAEADITAPDGTVDLPRSIINELDIFIAGLHPYVWPSVINGVWSVVGINQAARFSRSAREKARVNNTKALKETVNRYNVDIVSHPDLRMPVDIPELAAACAAADTAIEINTGHHYDKSELVKNAAGEGVNFVVSSDAHFPATVGELEAGGLLLEKFGVPAERVVNARKSRS